MDLIRFPEMSRGNLRAMRQTVDGAFRDFTRAWGDTLEAIFAPLQSLLTFIENLLIRSPWIAVLAVLAAGIWLVSRSWKIALGSVLALLVVGYFGMWEDTMRTIAMVAVCTLIAVVLGIPVGILMAQSNRMNAMVTPILDMMQTMPSFVYLIPVVMIFGLGKVPGLIAVVIYAIPPVIRLTNLGIRQVAPDVLEAAEAFGSSSWQKLRDVQLPLALPTIMAGINQTIMMSLAMVVVASMIGVRGLGQPVLQAINQQYFTMGVMNGLAIVAIAIIMDRTTQAYGKRLQKHTEAGK
ncbi:MULTISPECIES: ABC transporter permease [Paracoccus]|jgi:glycine betaine/proline transport system permease protein|uniref:Binding-protein-dependent transport systems inner membrane component n=1 Tax=Paracoccus denitrificans (strain Pd 1222) TaxID=318586 RepID=A1B8S9_PARDP|nr:MULTISPECIES: proline/glycine betaine ABC transporter permease [Paracoccus]ABL71923.1 binding-protein-dependent transport systems inner membrane component [Paracoccus denitrificans PD1222]MBB4626173.1 glycine betaine/proline transport system permease protein [Paracoccus denitrificans]MCU7430621.1 proline/glycine betaine ABC transporter permease [Paracoccus denitrificans]MDK8872692.1 proline/glycine betaine ABC transporter permease [Paracoccus sp. SSJ]QAR28506.1 proline/glycine betaine ABC t